MSVEHAISTTMSPAVEFLAPPPESPQPAEQPIEQPVALTDKERQEMRYNIDLGCAEYAAKQREAFRQAYLAECAATQAVATTVESPSKTAAEPARIQERDFWGPIPPERLAYQAQQQWLGRMPWHGRNNPAH